MMFAMNRTAFSLTLATLGTVVWAAVLTGTIAVEDLAAWQTSHHPELGAMIGPADVAAAWNTASLNCRLDYDELGCFGDAEKLNRLLVVCGELRSQPPVVLVLHAGSERRSVRRASGGFEPPFVEPFDWVLTIDRSEARDRQSAGCRLSIDVWLGQHVNLEQLKVPASITVRSGGEIESFIEGHEQSRRAIEHAGDSAGD